MQIVNFNLVKNKPHYVKALIYGQAGAGKTRFAADADKPFWFDFESSTETLRHWPDYSDIPVKHPASITELFSDIQKAVRDPDIGTIVIDSITTALDYYMRAEAEKRASKRDKYAFWEADYKYATQVFTDLFGVLQEAPLNVVIIGHERVSINPENNRVNGIYPDITPRLQQAVTRLVNVVGYMQAKPAGIKGETTRRLYLNRTEIIEAKNRLNIQDTFIEQPEWKLIFND
jgi:phage nucleotide-binding protein